MVTHYNVPVKSMPFLEPQPTTEASDGSNLKQNLHEPEPDYQNQSTGLPEEIWMKNTFIFKINF